MASSSLNAVARESASEATLSIDLVQTGAATTPIVADLQYDTSLLTLQDPVTLSGGHYRLTFKSRNNLALGEYSGTIQFRLCQQTACTAVYPGTTHVLPFKLDVVLNDWATLQRDATHRGYVGLTVDPSKIAQIWGVYSDSITGFSRVAADAERVYLGVTGYSGRTRLSAIFGLNLKTGEPLWSDLLGETDNIGDPAVSNGRVFIAYKDKPEDNPVSIRRTSDGVEIAKAHFASQALDFHAPTPVGDELFSAAGQYGNVVYSHRQTDGVLKWQTQGAFGRAWGLQTPAVDADRVYQYNGEGLDVFRRSDGAKLTTIADPSFDNQGYEYWGAPVILPDGSVLAYGGSLRAERMDLSLSTQRQLIRFRPNVNDIAWRTANTYRNIPAVRGGLIFAGRDGPSRLDAINISDGSIAWSWTPPDGTGFRSNIVVTDNVLFVSTTDNVYGISLSDRSVVWTYGEPGDLAIAPYNILLISELMPYQNASPNTGLRSAVRLSAFKLR